MSSDDTLRETAREQADAAWIIGNAFREAMPESVRPLVTDEWKERFARAVIARLTYNDPPLLVVYMHNVKERE